MLSTLKLFPDVGQQEEQGSLKNRASTKTVSSLRLIGEIYIQLYLTKHVVALNTTIFFINHITPSKELYAEYNTLSIPDMHVLQILLLVHKFIIKIVCHACIFKRLTLL